MSRCTTTRSGRRRRCCGRRSLFLVLLAAIGLVGIGCARGPDELLVAYSGNCQAYIEPCG